MKIVNRAGDLGRRAYEELGKIRSNEKGKIIDARVLDFIENGGLEDGERAVILSRGESMIKYFFKIYRERACLIIFSPDLSRNLKEIVDAGFLAENILLVGARNLAAEEISFLAENKIRQIGVNQVEINIEEASDVVMEFSSGKELFLEFDLNMLERFGIGGLTSRQAIYILSRMSLMRNLSAVEIKMNDDAEVAARLIAEVL